MDEKISYQSFCWSLGNTSFRTKDFNRTIETQLALLERFWNLPENIDALWNKATQRRYYYFLKSEGFVTGDANRPEKDAREKTSGLRDIGLIGEDHRLSGAGEALLKICRDNDFSSDNIFHIEKDSFIYLKQLLKTSWSPTDDDDSPLNVVRPMLILIHFLTHSALGGKITKDELTFLLPLCIDQASTVAIMNYIVQLRTGLITVDEIIPDILLAKNNYQEALKLFLKEPMSEDLICTIGINRKSGGYDKVYYALYRALEDLHLKHRPDAARRVLEAIAKISNARVASFWKTTIFDTTVLSALKKDPENHIEAKNPFLAVADEAQFRTVFFRIMHLNKAKSTLVDYYDLNRRYLSTSDIFLFQDNEIRLDIVPQQFFALCESVLFGQAFSKCDLLYEDVPLRAISPALDVDTASLLDRLAGHFNTHFTDLRQAMGEVDRERYERFNHLVESKFSTESLIRLLGHFENRHDKEIREAVTDNADVPTIFEYVLGIIWYRVSGMQGDVLQYMRLSLDANLLPKTHAAGGEADIVYEYTPTPVYPAHNLLIEATLANRTSQRSMEMEPVTRHLGNNILDKNNTSNYCLFISTDLNPNLISDFRLRKSMVWYDTADTSRKVIGLKIIPLSTGDLRAILSAKKYPEVYSLMEAAFRDDHYADPLDWYNYCVSSPLGKGNF